MSLKSELGAGDTVVIDGHRFRDVEGGCLSLVLVERTLKAATMAGVRKCWVQSAVLQMAVRDR